VKVASIRKLAQRRSVGWRWARRFPRCEGGFIAENDRTQEVPGGFLGHRRRSCSGSWQSIRICAAALGIGMELLFGTAPGWWRSRDQAL